MIPVFMLPESSKTEASYFYSSLQAQIDTLFSAGTQERLYLCWIQIYTVDNSLVGKMYGLSKVKFGDHFL